MACVDGKRVNKHKKNRLRKSDFVVSLTVIEITTLMDIILITYYIVND